MQINSYCEVTNSSCLKDLVDTEAMTSLSLVQESYTYKDPITEFVECLYVNFDFDSAQKKLRECESVRIALLSFPFTFFLHDSVCLSWCTGLNRPIKVSCLLGLRGSTEASLGYGALIS